METTLATHPILKTAERLGEQLKQIEEVQRFQMAEKQINQNEIVQSYIEQIKRKQKELVHAKHYQKSNYARQLEAELEQLNHEFEQLPIVREYQQIQVGVNELLQLIQDVIADTISGKLD